MRDALKYKLSDYEWNSLNHITSINKMDNWFCLKTDNDGYDYIYDMEEDKILPIGTALDYIYEGLLVDDFQKLEKEEQRALNTLFFKYGLSTFEEVV